MKTRPSDQIETHHHIRTVLSKEHYKKLVKAAQLANSPMLKNGFSISGSRKMLEESRQLLTDLMQHEDNIVSSTAKNIHKQVERFANSGWDGNGTFLTD